MVQIMPPAAARRPCSLQGALRLTWRLSIKDSNPHACASLPWSGAALSAGRPGKALRRCRAWHWGATRGLWGSRLSWEGRLQASSPPPRPFRATP